MRLRRHRRPRLPCGCRAGKPRYDCVTCQGIRLIRESIERAWDDAVREMHPPPAWRIRDVEGRTGRW